MTVIEVYADIWCPFAHVGLRLVTHRRKYLGREDVALRVRAWPLELVNGEPLDPETTAEHVHDLRSQLDLNLFSNFDVRNFPSTSIPALEVAALAYRKDDQTGEAVSLAVRDALFEAGRDLSSPAVLASLARANGLGIPDDRDHQAVLADWHEGESRGVKGSPHFFCGQSDSFCPSLDLSKDEAGRLHLQPNLERLDAFLNECFKI